MLTSLLNKDKCIFKEVRKLRQKKKQGISSKIDNEVGQENIASHFSNIYEQLFDNVNEDIKLASVEKNLNYQIESGAKDFIEKVDSRTIKSAVNK